VWYGVVCVRRELLGLKGRIVFGQWAGKCTGCGAWETLKPFTPFEVPGKKSARGKGSFSPLRSTGASPSGFVRLEDISGADSERLHVWSAELVRDAL
jgi:predicted ATP-dependent serine protease